MNHGNGTRAVSPMKRPSQRYAVCLTIVVLMLAPFQMGMARQASMMPPAGQGIDVATMVSVGDVGYVGGNCDEASMPCAGCLACAPLAGPVTEVPPVRFPSLHIRTRVRILAGITESPAFRPPIPSAR